MNEQSEIPKLAFLELQTPEYLERLRDELIRKVGSAALFSNWITGELVTWRREEATERPHKLGLDTFPATDEGSQFHMLHERREHIRSLQYTHQQTIEDISTVLSDWGFEEPIDWPTSLTPKPVQLADPWGGDAC